jgi:hypothetical protein
MTDKVTTGGDGVEIMIRKIEDRRETGKWFPLIVSEPIPVGQCIQVEGMPWVFRVKRSPTRPTALVRILR